MTVPENLKLFGKITNLASTIHGIPFSWDPFEGKLIQNLDPAQRKELRFRTSLLRLNTIFLLIQMGYYYSTTKVEDRPSIVTLLTGIGIIAFPAATTYGYQFQKESAEIIQFMNGIISMYNRLGGKRKGSLTGFISRGVRQQLIVIYAYMLWLTELTFAFIYSFGLHWFQPCMPSLVGYWMLEECKTLSVHCHVSHGWPDFVKFAWRNSIKLPVFLWNYWMFTYCVRVCIFGMVNLQLLTPPTIKYLLIRFMEQNLCGKLLNLQTAIDFRTIQNLIQLLNAIQQKSLLTMLISGCIIINSFTLTFLVLTEWKLENWLALLPAIIVCIEALFILLLILGGMSEVYSESIMVLRTMAGHRNPWRKRFLKSCGPLKIKFGTVNFVDELAPLHCSDFAYLTAINMMLVSNNQ